MRNMSFALTTPQIKGMTKDVTRRMGWLHLKVGDVVRPVRKGMGLKPGEKIEQVGHPLFITNVRRESLSLMLTDDVYGAEECAREGFPEMLPAEFVSMFCKTHKGCTPDSVVTRIEFIYELTL